MEFKRKANRLNQELYRHQRVYFLTLCCLDETANLTDSKTVDWMLNELKACCVKHGFKNLAYCFMPDHLHLLLEGQEDSDLIKLIKLFKQLTGYRFCKETNNKLWQKSYYDHILRKEEDVRSIVKYILENPIRKNLVIKPEEYPFSGSLEYGTEIFKM
jgi:putative transposase